MVRLCVALAAFTIACKPEVEPPPADTGPSTREVELKFAAEVDGFPFSCGNQYADIGATQSVGVRFTDLRMYVHDVKLLSAGGAETPVVPEDDAFSADGVTLLDFENAGGYCEGGTAETHTSVRATVPAGAVTGLQFTIGVPESMNFEAIDEQTPAPLAIPSLFRDPFEGYSFFYANVASSGTPEGWPARIHATGCTTDDFGNVEACTAPNLLTVTLPNFDPETQQVVLDLGDLFARSSLDDDQDRPGCESAPTDPDCPPLFTSYGLVKALPQAWIRAE
jgi:uncharacterized repeat protein (TIGR04052 family)